MTTWAASVGEILDVRADALVCSANPQLNLSGGVGGEFLRRFGPDMQTFLHDWLRQSGQKYVVPATVVAAPSAGSPFRSVLHACAIDAFYETSADLIRQTYQNALQSASQSGCRSVVSACLGCGYGRARPEVFAAGLEGWINTEIPGVDSFEFRSTNREIIDTILRALK